MEQGREGNYWEKGRDKRWVLRREKNNFRDRDKGLKVYYIGEADERVDRDKGLKVYYIDEADERVDRDKGLKVYYIGEADERVIFVISLIGSSLTSAYVLRLGGREFQR